MNKVNYTTLQQSLDVVLGKIGLPKTVKLLCSFISNSSLSTTQVEKLKLVTTYIISQAIVIFDLNEEEFYDSRIPEYREARMACYHLLKKYTDSSYSKIGERFGLKKRQVLYYHQKCEEMLSISQYYKAFTAKYKDLEELTIEFIAKF